MQGAHDVLKALSSCASGHRRTQDKSNSTRQLTGGELSQIMEMHLAGKIDLDADVDASSLLKPAIDGTSSVAVPSNRRQLLDCVDSQ
eukprot:COSAG01_NODE_4260_length_5200_cov_7.101353_2_plen_87_part_00